MIKTSKILSLITVVFLLFNCSNDDDSTDSSNIKFSPELLDGTWRISFFSDENTQRTQEFNSYEFTFDYGEETVWVKSNGSTEMGLLRVFQSVINGSEYWIVEVDFSNTVNPGNADLQDLNEEWIVKNVLNAADKIEFEERFSNNTPELLHLERLLN